MTLGAAIWNITVLAVFSWAVFSEGHSGWWFALAVFLLAM